MRAYTHLVSGLVFPLHERLKRHDTVRIRRELERTQWLPLPELEALRVSRLRTFLSEIQGHVPYYRDLFAERGFDPARADSLACLEQLPFLTKSLIRANTDRLCSETAGELQRFNTGGSSGEPLIFYISRERVSHDVAAKWRATRWWDVDIGDREIVVWGSPIELTAQDRMRKLRDLLLRSELLPAFEMSPAKLDGFVARIAERRPRMLFGYPSALSLIARHARARGVALDHLGIRVAFVTSERLDPDQRREIEQTFGCRVANGYGSRDAGFIAHECPAGAMHVTAEDVIVEIVDSHGRPVPRGHAGEIIVTHLATRDFPFLRYKSGDIGSFDDRQCSCGRTLPILKEISGRTTDFVYSSDGVAMHGLALVYVLREQHGVEAFRIVQESLQRTAVYVVPGADYTPTVTAKIVAGLRARLGAGVDIAIHCVDEIPPERSGKFRYVVSNVKPPELETQSG